MYICFKKNLHIIFRILRLSGPVDIYIHICIWYIHKDIFLLIFVTTSLTVKNREHQA